MASQQNLRYFDWVDYSVFGLLLTGSVSIGIYFGFLSKRKQTTKLEYLLGSREIGLIPLSMSLIATQFSGVSLLGYPAEVYTYGTQHTILMYLDIVMAPIMIYWVVPVFYNLDQTSMYEYLNRRFSPAVRTLGTLLFVMKMILLTPVMMYAPALALSQVSGLPQQAIIPITCLVCTFYTTIGGMKAVVWTDSLQFLVMISCLVLITTKGTLDVGGFQKIFDISSKGQRIEYFNMSLDPTVRYSFWNILIGQNLYHISYFFVNQGTLQRVMAAPSLKKAQQSIALLFCGSWVFFHFIFFIGLLTYASFADCDPVTTGQVRKFDQIVPYFVMKAGSHIPALPGIFLSAIFSASLSTMSTALNSMSGVIVEDLIQPLFKRNIPQARASLYMKMLTVILGVVITGLTFAAENLSGLVQGSKSLSSAASSSLMGCLLMGMFLPWANSHGALAGTLSALGLVSWMAFGQQLAIYSKRIVNPVKPASIAGCDNSTLAHFYNTTAILHSVSDTRAELDPPFYLYRISYTWYSLIAITTVLTVGMLVSWMTGVNSSRETDHNLFSPAIRRFLKKPSLVRSYNDKDSRNPEQCLTLMSNRDLGAKTESKTTR